MGTVEGDEAVWRPGVTALDGVRQLPPAARDALGAELRFTTVEVAAESEADGGATVKLLAGLDGGLTVETVAMETRASSRIEMGTLMECDPWYGPAELGCPPCASC